MSVSVVFSQSAIRDLQTIGDYIAQDSRKQAVRFVTNLKGRCLKIAETPEGAAVRNDILPDMRIVPFGRYLIFYRFTDHVRIVRVLHSARDAGAIFDKMTQKS